MPLSAGDRLGPFEVTGELGAGGMGIVLRARDTKLDRDVALKVLPEAFTADPDRLARFEREAKVLASLNHPNIGSIYGLEEADGGKFRALVLELVEGPTLADRITQGPIPLDEVLAIATQIAEALEAAHEQGVIHRDLKPANIKVREDGTVKVLDFGLAKALEVDGADLAEAPTKTAAATRAGAILGTPAYMAPEQAKGLATGRRSDIWAFGVVLYEMLTGQRAFAGDGTAETLAAVLRAEPDWDALPHATPARLRQVVTACVQRDQRQRLHDMADVRLAMDGRFESPVVAGVDESGAPSRFWQRPLPVALGAVALVLVTGLAVWRLVAQTPAAGPVSRFVIPLVDDTMHGMALSPSGDRVVYSASSDGEQWLFVRFRDQIEAVPLRGTEGGTHPFFSPDGRSIGFSTTSELKRVPVDGGPAVTLCALDAHRGATWGVDGTIVFAPRNTPNIRGLMRVSESGGEPQPITSPPQEEGRHAWPHFMPDGRSVLFTTGPDSPLTSKRVALLSLETGAQTELTAGTGPTYVSTGHLVFGREDSLWSARFDPERPALAGAPTPMVEAVFVGTGNGVANYAVADDGTMAYRLSPASVGGPSAAPVWLDRNGREERVPIPSRRYTSPRISPDGTRLAVSVIDSDNRDVWVIDLARGTQTPVTTHPDRDNRPVWTPDGLGIIFQSDRDGLLGIFLKAADGRGNVERLLALENTNLLSPLALTPDHRSLVFMYRLSETGYSQDLGLLSLEGERTWQPFLESAANESGAVFSPDGAWIAYVTDETGEAEVFVDDFPRRETHRRASTAGGHAPVWSGRAGELIYRGPGGATMSVGVPTEPTARISTPIRVSETPYYSAGGERQYDVTSDGSRFLMLTAQEDAPVAPIHVVLNWTQELLERVPTN